MQWPYDAAPPRGVPAGTGITVNAVFTDPGGRRFTQPAFYSEEFLDEVREGRDWHLPTGRFGWKVRFSPDRAGAWTYRIVAVDKGGAVESRYHTLHRHGLGQQGLRQGQQGRSPLLRVRRRLAVPRDGLQPSRTTWDSPSTKGRPAYERLAANGVNLVRVWVSSIYGSAWNSWVGGRNQYRGYLPVTGLVPFRRRGDGPDHAGHEARLRGRGRHRLVRRLPHAALVGRPGGVGQAAHPIPPPCRVPRARASAGRGIRASATTASSPRSRRVASRRATSRARARRSRATAATPPASAPSRARWYSGGRELPAADVPGARERPPGRGLRAVGLAARGPRQRRVRRRR